MEHVTTRTQGSKIQQDKAVTSPPPHRPARRAGNGALTRFVRKTVGAKHDIKNPVQTSDVTSGPAAMPV
ncbi:hypothetical protein D3Z39_06320 [Anaerotruncus colihominis]|uniref:Uncharacterized protein n=1 Tax=Anaerotruncus colihominis TaxID=169435 RepID=A0A845RI37_9FIRM|nr:hypothetical protein [Anaerotruncus colihominis]